MKKYIFMALLGLSLSVPKAHAQWVVTDPGNFAGNIVNSVKEIATASKTVKNTLDGFKEVEKLYNDTKKYYDALKKVNNLIGDAYKVKECILMVATSLRFMLPRIRKCSRTRTSALQNSRRWLRAMPSSWNRVVRVSRN